MKIIPSLITSLGLTALLAGCSSMAPDNDQERLDGLLPADFSVSVYSTLNPDVAVSQAVGAITDKNVVYTDSLTSLGISAADIAALKTADDSIFLSDSVALQMIHTNYLGKTWDSTLAKNDLAAVKRFNIFGATNELAFVADYLSTKLDSALISDSYVSFGRVEGRAYRLCTASDAKTTLRSINLDGALVGKKLDYSGYKFCQDATNPDNLYVVD